MIDDMVIFILGGLFGFFIIGILIASSKWVADVWSWGVYRFSQWVSNTFMGGK